MKMDTDVLLLATRLVDEMGEVALRISRVRLVELTAANNLRAAAFWRDVLHACQRLLADRAGPHEEGSDVGVPSPAVATAAASSATGRAALQGEAPG